MQPVGNDEQDCSFFCENETLDNQEIKETHFCYNERNNINSDSHIPLSIGDSLDMKPTPEFELAQVRNHFLFSFIIKIFWDLAFCLGSLAREPVVWEAYFTFRVIISQ